MTCEEIYNNLYDIYVDVSNLLTQLNNEPKPITSEKCSWYRQQLASYQTQWNQYYSMWVEQNCLYQGGTGSNVITAWSGLVSSFEALLAIVCPLSTPPGGGN